jgi:aldehyde dehydrogenase (NAD+)
MNAGQVCLAPDYILVDKAVEAQLITKLNDALREFYGPEENRVNNDDLGKIINERHFDRIKGLLDSAGGKVVGGGQTNRATKFIAPTLIKEPSRDAAIMHEEIFGPLLPIVGVDDLNDAIRIIKSKPKPLALYVFTQSTSTAEMVLARTSSGGAVINDAVIHNANPHLPFGGVGNSGMGQYHGAWGFDQFSHMKAVFKQPTFIDMGALRYPPYTEKKLRTLTWLIRILPDVPKISFSSVAIVGLSIAVALLAARSAGKL